MKANALVRLKFPSEKHLEIVFKALEPEIKTDHAFPSIFGEREHFFDFEN